MRARATRPALGPRLRTVHLGEWKLPSGAMCSAFATVADGCASLHVVRDTRVPDCDSDREAFDRHVLPGVLRALADAANIPLEHLRTKELA